MLQGEGQAIWTVARSITVMKFRQLLVPLLTLGHMDRLLWAMLESASGLSVHPKGGYWNRSGVFPTDRCGTSTGKIMDWMIQLPMKLGGIIWLEQALPDSVCRGLYVVDACLG